MKNSDAFSGHALGALWARRPAVMGVVNVTPDSFADGGKYMSTDKAIAHGVKLVSEGADIIDIGGESTRSGAEEIDSAEQIARVVPVIKGLKAHAKFISIDTRNADVMEAAITAGANIINDVSALADDPRSLYVAASANVPVILMHRLGNAATMQKNPKYNNVVQEVIQYLQQKIQACGTHRIDAEMIVIDPGIGFGKTVEHNVLLLKNLNEFSALGCPLLIGVSRKSFIGKIAGDAPADERIPGSLASAIWAAEQGTKILRVHDVKETVQALEVYRAIANAA
jgi:dihydropteroate synthase